jgi:uncharacterized repeat protein (TIGR03803 family)
MRTFANLALTIGAAALLAGCGGSQPSIGAPPTAQQVNGDSGQPLNNGGYKLLYSFKGGSDGDVPFAGLIFVKGMLYGTTTYGGYLSSPCNSSNGCGTVFRMSTTGSKKVIYTFKGGSDATGPVVALFYLNGMLYGTTQSGGSISCACGTVFGVTPSGSEHVVYTFTGGSDGSTPFASLIAVNGNLYGTTYFGGGSTRCAGGCGTVFEMDTAGRERIIHRFRGYPHDGEHPIGALIALNGQLYGTTWIGGSGACYVGCGTIFEVSTSGKEQVLHNFTGAPDGENPEGGLVDVGGKLYGTTVDGGTSGACPKAGGCGTFFRLTPSSASESYSVVYSFVGDRNSAEPNGGLLPLNGIFYGTAEGGNRCGYYYRCGTVFDVSTTGKERLLHRFYSQGQEPKSPGWPLVARNGLIYGTTVAGGASNLGAVYSIEP